MDKKSKIEIARNILNNAIKINARKEILLRISQKIDKYIVEYLQKCMEKRWEINAKGCENFDERE